MGNPAGGRAARALVATAATLSLLLSIGTAAGAAMWFNLRDVGTVEGFRRVPPSVSSGASPSPLPTGPCAERACNYLLMGSDSRAGLTPEEQQQFGNEGDVGGDERADTVMLVHADPDKGKAVILSFPRDLWVQIPDVGWGKLNSAFAGGLEGGGPTRMAETIANLTGLTIDHFLYVDFNGFQDVVDTIGGVEMCPPSYLANADGRIVDAYSSLDIAPGCQRMDGPTALAFVRSRHLPCDNIPDFSRIGRQQQFFRALITQMLRPSQILRATGLVQPVLRAMHRDADLLPGDLVSLVGDMRSLTTGAATFRAVPGVSGMEGSLSVVRMDPSAEQLFAAIREGKPVSEIGATLPGTPPSPANIDVVVLDASAQGAADHVENFLGDAGFDVAPGIQPSSSTTGAAIVYAPGSDEEAAIVAKYLPGLPIREAPWLHAASVGVIVPDGYAIPEQPSGDATACPSP
jgi:LCP family protein required for cell wall assembly